MDNNVVTCAVIVKSLITTYNKTFVCQLLRTRNIDSKTCSVMCLVKNTCTSCS